MLAGPQTFSITGHSFLGTSEVVCDGAWASSARNQNKLNNVLSDELDHTGRPRFGRFIDCQVSVYITVRLWITTRLLAPLVGWCCFSSQRSHRLLTWTIDDHDDNLPRLVRWCHTRSQLALGKGHNVLRIVSLHPQNLESELEVRINCIFHTIVC